MNTLTPRDFKLENKLFLYAEVRPTKLDLQGFQDSVCLRSLTLVQDAEVLTDGQRRLSADEEVFPN